MASIKKTFRITEVRSEQLEIMQEFLQSKGYKGTQTEIIEKAIMDQYNGMRQADLGFFKQKEEEARVKGLTFYGS